MSFKRKLSNPNDPKFWTKEKYSKKSNKIETETRISYRSWEAQGKKPGRPKQYNTPEMMVRFFDQHSDVRSVPGVILKY